MPGMKPLIVGESNPYGTDPRLALYPYPERASGDRLCRIVMGLSPRQYLARFDRANLCIGKFDLRRAREAAAAILADTDAEKILLLGARVARAFGLRFEPLRAKRPSAFGPDLLMLPHPSGLNRVWNDPSYMEEARCFLKMEGVL